MLSKYCKKFFIYATVFSPIFLSANMGPQGFHQFKKRVFVETGTFRGAGIQKALDAGFEEVYSIDIEPLFVRETQRSFKEKKNVHIDWKDSSYQLWDVIESIKEPIVFWLDAHNHCMDADIRGIKNTPLLEELDQIKRHPIKNHTILIDDLHCCNTVLFDFLSLNEIIAKVLEINPKYEISYVDGGDDGEYHNNILVASISEDQDDL